MPYSHERNSAHSNCQESEPKNQSAEAIAKALGGFRAGGQWLARCPAHEDRRPSPSIRDGGRGPILNCLAGCDFKDVRDALRQRGILPAFRPGTQQQAPAKPLPVAPSADDLRKTAMAKRIVDRAFPCLMSSPCERYLTRRGIWLAAERTPMRYARLVHPQTREENVPCLVIPRHSTRTGVVAGCQRVFLTEDGCNYPKKPYALPDGSTALTDAKLSLGISANAWAMLHTATDKLVLCEGVESALSAAILFERPAWARCGPFPTEMALPEHVRDVLIVADNDAPTKNGKPRVTSEQKAIRLAAFIRSTGRRCEVVVPPEVGTDINDVLVRGAA